MPEYVTTDNINTLAPSGTFKYNSKEISQNELRIMNFFKTINTIVPYEYVTFVNGKCDISQYSSDWSFQAIYKFKIFQYKFINCEHQLYGVILWTFDHWVDIILIYTYILYIIYGGKTNSEPNRNRNIILNSAM